MSKSGSPSYRRKREDLIAVAKEHINEPGVYYQPVAHDDDCPALTTQRLKDCTCEPEYWQPRRIA